MTTVSPKLSSPPTPTMRRRLVDAGEAARKADAELRASVIDALDAGVSVREVAALTDISTNTVQRWKREAHR
jgi:DNA invertase Pin-like site-specific DNA recombinase